MKYKSTHARKYFEFVAIDVPFSLGINLRFHVSHTCAQLELLLHELIWLLGCDHLACTAESMAANSNTDSSATPPTPPPAAAVDSGDDNGAVQVQKLRENGNVAFASKNMADAKKFYSEALDVATSHGINDSSHDCHKIYSNR